ncbi:MAG: SRPBCC family protein [Flavitalea sp.]
MSEKYIGTVDVSEEFNVPVETLYKAWTDEAALRAWWHPFQKDLSAIKNELKSGGLVEYEFGGDRRCVVRGKYNEVSENRRLVYSWNWDIDHDEMGSGEYVLTIDFLPNGDGSKLVVHQEGFTDEPATLPHKQGWKRGLGELKNYLEANSKKSV